MIEEDTTIPYCPIGHDFEACDQVEVQPVIEHLASNVSVKKETTFPRGTHLPDGRLDLCKQEIGPIGTSAVASAIAKNTAVRHLLMGANGMGNDGALALSDMLSQNNSLETLYLGCNRIDERGAVPLVDAVAKHCNIKAFWIKRNPIGLEGAKRIAMLLRHSETIRTIDLVHTQLCAESVRLIAEALTVESTPLNRLYLAGNALTPDAIEPLCTMLQTNRSLRHLYLDVNQLGDAGTTQLAKGLRHNVGLVTLGLASNGIGEQGATALSSALGEHPTLQHLSLGYEKSTRVLGEQPNHLSDGGAFAMALLLNANPRLRKLDLRRNNITAAGANQLCIALHQHQSLIELNLGKGIPHRIKREIRTLLDRNRDNANVAYQTDDEDIRAIASVYRTIPLKNKVPATA